MTIILTEELLSLGLWEVLVFLAHTVATYFCNRSWKVRCVLLTESRRCYACSMKGQKMIEDILMCFIKTKIQVVVSKVLLEMICSLDSKIHTHEFRVCLCRRCRTADCEEEISHPCFVLCSGDLEQVWFPQPPPTKKRPKKTVCWMCFWLFEMLTFGMIQQRWRNFMELPFWSTNLSFKKKNTWKKHLQWENERSTNQVFDVSIGSTRMSQEVGKWLGSMGFNPNIPHL